MIALLGDHGGGTHGPYLARRAEDRRLFGQLAQLGVVEDETVHALDHGDKVVAGDIDPQVHRVQGRPPRTGALVEHRRLQRGLDVGQEQDVALPRGLAELGLEVLEHTELGVERLAGVQIPAVLAAPEERLPFGDDLDVVGQGAARAQNLAVRRGEIPADRTDDPHLVKQQAASAKWVSAPPSIRSRSPNGVFTAS